MDLIEKLKQPKNKLRIFSYILYAILFAAWFIFDFKISYLVTGLFIILAAKMLFALNLANRISIEAKAKQIKRRKAGVESPRSRAEATSPKRKAVKR